MTISEDDSITETFNDFFVDIGSKLASEIDTQRLNENNADSDTGNNIPHLYNADSDTNNNPHLNTLFKFRAIIEQEIITDLSNLKVSKSAGLDTIPARVLRMSANCIKKGNFC